MHPSIIAATIVAPSTNVIADKNRMIKEFSESLDLSLSISAIEAINIKADSMIKM